jgi:hypothetical protein
MFQYVLIKYIVFFCFSVYFAFTFAFIILELCTKSLIYTGRGYSCKLLIAHTNMICLYQERFTYELTLGYGKSSCPIGCRKYYLISYIY